MNKTTNDAVAQYRKALLAEQVADEEREKLEQTLNDPDLDVQEYAKATMEIDTAVDDAEQLADAKGYAPSTRRQRVRQAVNSAGLDMQLA